MSSMISWEHLAAQASRLEPSDRLRLVEHIVHGLTVAGEAPAAHERRPWREIRARTVGPLCSEDAQAWVSRGRRESDETRDAAMGGKP